MEEKAQQEASPVPGIFLGIVIIAIAEALLYMTNTIYMTIYGLGIVLLAVSANKCLMGELSIAKDERNSGLSFFALTMYLPLAGILYFFSTRLFNLVSMAA
jgi:hypothetical protein